MTSWSICLLRFLNARPPIFQMYIGSLEHNDHIVNQEESIQGNKSMTRSRFGRGPSPTPKETEEPIPKDVQDYEALHYINGDTLKATNNRKHFIETDQEFLSDVEGIVKLDGGAFTLFEKKKTDDDLELTDQQCEELHYRGKLHQQANIANANTKLDFEQAKEGERCECGCKKARGDKLPVCGDRQQLQFLGSGIMLFFLFVKGLIFNILISVMIYCIFATASNILQSQRSSGYPVTLKDNCADVRCWFLRSSSAQFNTDENLKQIEFILGVCLCFVWIFSLRVVKMVGRKEDKALDESLNTSSDFAILISNLPFGQYEEADILDLFKRLQDQNHAQKQEDDHSPFGMKSIQIIYKVQFARKLMEKIKEDCKALYSLVKTKKDQKLIRKADLQAYKQKKISLTQNYELLNDLRKKFLNDRKFRKKIATSTCLIEFNKEEDKDALLAEFGQQRMGMLKQLQQKVSKLCCVSKNVIVFRGNVLTIERAPQPSDLQWLNCEKQRSTGRVFVIYGVTFLMIIFSFCLMLGLQSINVYFIIQSESSSSDTALLMSLATAAALQIVNKVLWIVLYLLLDFEYNDTLTGKIVSLMNKALLATCINILILPLLAYGIFNDYLYGSNGLVGFAFNYHLAAITAGMLLRLFTPGRVFKGIVTCIQPLRHKWIRYMRYKYSQQDEEAFKKRVNEFYEGEYFDVAEEYIFALTNIFHAVFYSHLLPPLLLFALLETMIFYWINKYKILRHFKIPELTEILAFDTAVLQAGLTPMIYGLGLLFITYVQERHNDQYEFSLVFPMIAIVIAALSFGNPGDVFNRITKCALAVCGMYEEPPSKQELKEMREQKEREKQEEENSKIEKTNTQLIKKDDMNCGLTSFLKTEKEEESKDEVQVVRLQTYYKNSNSLQLLGFENVLKGKDTKEFSEQLGGFCQSFFPENKKVVKEVLNEIKHKTLVGDMRPYIEDEVESHEMTENHNNFSESSYS